MQEGLGALHHRLRRRPGVVPELKRRSDAPILHEETVKWSFSCSGGKNGRNILKPLAQTLPNARASRQCKSPKRCCVKSFHQTNRGLKRLGKSQGEKATGKNDLAATTWLLPKVSTLELQIWDHPTWLKRQAHASTQMLGVH